MKNSLKKNTIIDKILLVFFLFAEILLLISFLPPVIDIIMDLLVSFSSDGVFNADHWKNIFNLYALKSLFVITLLFIFVYIKYKNQTSIKDSFELFAEVINKMSRPIQVLLAFSLILIFHSFITLDTFDDGWFKKQIQEFSILPYISDRYFTWTSRFLIEFLMFGTFAVNDGVWRVLDSIALLVIVECIIKLAVPEDKKRYSFLAYAIVLFIPIMSLSSCGWGAVTCNYVWPCAEIMPVFVIMKRLFNREKVPAWQFLVSIPLAIIACNQEQMAALVLGITSVLILYRLITGQRRFGDNWYFLVVLLVSAASIAFILACPGNPVRYEVEMNGSFPEYNKIPLFKKVLMSIPSVFSFFFGIRIPNIVILPLLAMVTVLTFDKKYNSLKPFVIILDLFVIVFGYLGFVLSRFCPFFIFQNNRLYPFGEISFLASIIECLAFTFMAVILAVAVFKCSRGRIHGLLNVMLLAAAYCSGAIRAFSPTVYQEDGGRMLFFSMIMILYVAFDIFVSNIKGERKGQL